jgi:hypothetical protein
MPPAVRVVGRFDVAEQVEAALRAAGAATELSAGIHRAILAAPPPAEGADVVVATGSADVALWQLAKRTHPHRPLVAVAPRGREAVLRGSVVGLRGADAWAAWPCTGQELLEAVGKAIAGVDRPRRKAPWERAREAEALLRPLGVLTFPAWLFAGYLRAPWLVATTVVMMTAWALGTGLAILARSRWSWSPGGARVWGALHLVVGGCGAGYLAWMALRA